jgi:hypothetical protein
VKHVNRERERESARLCATLQVLDMWSMLTKRERESLCATLQVLDMWSMLTERERECENEF